MERFTIQVQVDLEEHSRTATDTAKCSVHGEIFKLVIPFWVFSLESMKKTRKVLFGDHIRRFHGEDRVGFWVHEEKGS